MVPTSETATKKIAQMPKIVSVNCRPESNRHKAKQTLGNFLKNEKPGIMLCQENFRNFLNAVGLTEKEKFGYGGHFEAGIFWDRSQGFEAKQLIFTGGDTFPGANRQGISKFSHQNQITLGIFEFDSNQDKSVEILFASWYSPSSGLANWELATVLKDMLNFVESYGKVHANIQTIIVGGCFKDDVSELFAANSTPNGFQLLTTESSSSKAGSPDNFLLYKGSEIDIYPDICNTLESLVEIETFSVALGKLSLKVADIPVQNNTVTSDKTEPTNVQKRSVVSIVEKKGVEVEEVKIQTVKSDIDRNITNDNKINTGAPSKANQGLIPKVPNVNANRIEESDLKTPTAEQVKKYNDKFGSPKLDQESQTTPRTEAVKVSSPTKKKKKCCKCCFRFCCRSKHRDEDNSS